MALLKGGSAYEGEAIEPKGSNAPVCAAGKMLVVLAAAVPDGIVCFFVSYFYMDTIVSKWNDLGILQAGPAHGLLPRFSQRCAAPGMACCHRLSACTL